MLFHRQGHKNWWHNRFTLNPGTFMPTISQFFGIVIQMFWREHAPPHFHALYGEHEAQIDIRTLEVIVGHLPRRALNHTIEWAIEHRVELMEDWNLCQAKQQPRKIQPLEQRQVYRGESGPFPCCPITDWRSLFAMAVTALSTAHPS
jgi:hypothetical protein